MITDYFWFGVFVGIVCAWGYELVREIILDIFGEKVEKLK